LRNLIKAVPYKVHTVLTDNGTHFTDPSGESWTVADIKAMIERKEPFWAHAFDVACARNDIDHRLTKPKHPWTNGQVERMHRTIKDATVKRFHYDTHDELRSHLALKASRPTNTSARPGQKSPNDSPSTRSSKCRD
jgi:transposase InsO family protein